MRIISIVFGLLLVLTFFGLSQTQVGLFIGFFPRWDNATPGELMTWVGYLGLLLPAGVFFGLGGADFLARAGRWLSEKLDELSTRERWIAATLGLVLVACIFRVARALVLLDLPITDEEYSFQFAGQILAGGQLLIEKPEWWAAAPQLFLFQREGMITSMDWPATIFTWAISEATHTGPWIFMLLAIAPIAPLFAVLRDRHDERWAILGTMLMVFSPMFFLLSMTTHTHVGSRAFVAIAIALAWFARDADRRWLAAFGFTAAIAMTFRPIESTAILGPVLGWVFLRRRDGRDLATRAGFIALGALLPLVVFVAYNILVTGSWTPPRFSQNELPSKVSEHFEPNFAFFSEPSLLWRRFGANLSYNLLMLCLFVGGPLLMLAAFVGERRDGFARALTVSILAVLGVALFHDDHGIHIVGPIHYSEAVIPLIILAMDGASRLSSQLRYDGDSSKRLVMSILLGCLLSSFVFTGWQSIALHRQAAAQEWAYSTFDGLPEDAVVLAPQLSQYRGANPEYRRVGGWVFQFRRPHPYGQDDVLILKYDDGVEPTEYFEGRPIFVAQPLEEEPWIGFTQVR